MSVKIAGKNLVPYINYESRKAIVVALSLLTRGTSAVLNLLLQLLNCVFGVQLIFSTVRARRIQSNGA